MKFLYTLTALSLALLLAACAAPAAQSEGAAPAAGTPVLSAAPAAEATPALMAAPTPILEMEEEDDSITFLGEDTAAADAAGGIGGAKAEALAAKVYGNELAGRPQTYACEGLAEYKGETYYSIYWSQLVEEDGVATNSYIGHFYVSLDGSDVLEGDVDSVFPPVIGGG